MNITHEHYPEPAAYCRLWRKVIAAATEHPEQRVDPIWAWRKMNGSNAQTVRQLREQFTKALQSRINQRGGIDGSRGRKDSPDYYARLWRDSRAIRRRVMDRVMLHSLETIEARQHYSHLVDGYDD